MIIKIYPLDTGGPSSNMCTPVDRYYLSADIYN